MLNKIILKFKIKKKKKKKKKKKTIKKKNDNNNIFKMMHSVFHHLK